MQYMRLKIPDTVYDKVTQQAREQGKTIDDFIVETLADRCDIDRSFLRKSGIHRCLRGDSIINNGNLVRLNGIFHNYRLQGESTDGHVEEIDPQKIYKVSGFDGNVAILQPQ